jgi:hypothetical protein
VLYVLVAALFAAILLVPASALGAGYGGGQGGGGGPGEEPAEETANNLSVPALFVGPNPFGLTCNGTAVDPTGTPLSSYPLDPTAFYYVQGIHTWQAGCVENLSAASAAAEWGDNLTGEARKTVGKPIRVEMGLNAGNQGLTGYDVVKLEPDELDHVADYGMLADLSGKQAPYPETRVWDSGAHLKITNVATGAVVVDEAAKAEINSTGRVVYGYNLRVTSAGTYRIEFTAPNVSITSADGGTVVGNTVTLDIVVQPGGGGGGRPR